MLDTSVCTLAQGERDQEASSKHEPPPQPTCSRSESEEDEDINNLADTFKAKLGLLHSSLHSITVKCSCLDTELGIADSNSTEFASRLQQAEQTIARLRAEQELGSMREELLQQQVYRLEAMLESDRLQASLSENRLQQLLAEERVRSDRMRALRDGMANQRDDAVLELASVCADLDAMQATLADSAVYVRYLRKKVLELEVQNSRHAARSALHKPDPQQGDPGVFSLQAIRQKVQEAVREACQCDDEEKKRRLLRQMQLRWHPDKNPLLTEVATEVSKLINEATAQAGL